MITKEKRQPFARFNKKGYRKLTPEADAQLEQLVRCLGPMGAAQRISSTVTTIETVLHGGLARNAVVDRLEQAIMQTKENEDATVSRTG